eukprot:3029377-Prymnesium_polylepis.1
MRSPQREAPDFEPAAVLPVRLHSGVAQGGTAQHLLPRAVNARRLGVAPSCVALDLHRSAGRSASNPHRGKRTSIAALRYGCRQQHEARTPELARGAPHISHHVGVIWDRGV